MREAQSESQVLMYRDKIFEIQKNPDYEDFKRDNKRNMAVAGAASAIAGAGVAVALSSGEKPSRFKFPKFPHNLRGHRT